MKKIAILAAVALSSAMIQMPALARAQFGTVPLAASSVPQAQLIQPADLNKLLSATGKARPLILQVGFRVMFDQAHIPGSEYVGPGSRDEGLAALRQRVQMLPKNTFIVLYCGCCPWTRCPNVGSAFKQMHDLGFTNVKVLYLADNFGANWASHGYAVAQ